MRGPIGVVCAEASDGIALPVLDAFQAMGYEAFGLVLDTQWQHRNVTELVVPGPTYALNRLFAQLPRSLREWPGIRVWLTEQTPDPAIPPWRLRAWTSSLDRVHALELRIWRHYGRHRQWGALQRRLHRAQRLRLASQLHWLHRIGRLHRLATMTPSHADYYRDRFGLPADCVPYGFTSTWGRDLGMVRDIDVLFLGSTRDARRGPIIARLRADLAQRDIRLRVHDGSPKGPCVFGEERTLLINRTKLFLNIMRQPWDDLVFRMLLAAPNGATVISEPVVDRVPFAPSTHFASAPLDALPDAILRWLADRAGREELASAARRQVVENMAMPNMLDRLMGSPSSGAYGLQIGTTPEHDGRRHDA